MGIKVIGSLNMDLVLAVPHQAKPGETLKAAGVRYVPGGKGANQAVAAARMGGAVAMAGMVGDDPFGRELLRFLMEENIDVSHIGVKNDTPTGLAVISVSPDGENSIVLASGANGLFAVHDIPGALNDTKGRGMVMLQLEIPLDAVRMAALNAREQGAFVILDPAPAPLPAGVLAAVNLIVPNQIEAECLTGVRVTDPDSGKIAAQKLLALGPRQAIVKLGAGGVIVADGRRIEHIPGIKVETVDTTAAGDVFAGALAAALHEGRTLVEAAAFANQAAAISTTRPGAMSSIPRLEELTGL